MRAALYECDVIPPLGGLVRFDQGRGHGRVPEAGDIVTDRAPAIAERLSK